MTRIRFHEQTYSVYRIRGVTKFANKVARLYATKLPCYCANSQDNTIILPTKLRLLLVYSKFDAIREVVHPLAMARNIERNLITLCAIINCEERNRA